MNYLALIIVVLTASVSTALPADANKFNNNNEAKAINEQSGSSLGKIIGSR